MRAPILIRDLTPFEHQVLTLMCDGYTNSAIAEETHHTEKIIENTISRSAKAFTLEVGPDRNLRVLLALAYRTHFGDRAFEKFGIECQYAETGPDGKKMCHRHVERFS